MARSPDKAGSGPQKGKAPRPADLKTADLVAPGHQLSILVVDDDAVDRMRLNKALKDSRLNPKTEEATDIASALAALKQKQFDVLILDHILPDGNSLDLLRQLRVAGTKLPIVITTGFGDEMLVMEVIKAGASDYLPKDKVSAESVTRAISHAVRVYKAEEELRKQDSLLQGVAQAAVLLHTQSERLSIVNDALTVLGMGIGADRAVVFESRPHPETKEPAMCHRYEWAQATNETRFSDPERQNLSYAKAGLERWHTALSAGQMISGPVSNFPEAERKTLEAAGIRSLLLIPIFADGRFWGFVQFEDFRTERMWSQNERAILSAVATSIGSTLSQRRAEQALKQSEAQLRAIVETQPGLICRFLADGTHLFVNDNYCRFFGRKREELIGKSVLLLVPEADREMVRKYLAELTRQKPTGSFTHRMQPPGGTARWLRWDNHALFDTQGQVTEIQGFGQDVTEQRQMEDALRESEQKHRNLVELIPAITYTAALDEHSSTLFVSPQVQSLLGFSQAEYTANPDIWYQRLHPDDRDRVIAALERSRQSGEPFDSEYRMLAKDGHTVWFRDQAAYLLDEKRKPSVLHGVMYDITDVKQAEEALRQSQERWRIHYQSFPIPTYTWQKQGDDFILVGFNDAALRATGGALERARGARLSEFHKDVPESLRSVRTCFDEKTNITLETDYRFRTTGETRRLLVTCVYAPPDCVMVHTEDVTERRRADRALRESEEKYRTVIENLNVAVFRTTPDNAGRFLQVNPAHVRMLGYDTPEDLISTPVRDLYANPDERTEFVEELRLRDSVRDWEIVLKKKDGTRIRAKLTARMKFDDRGEPLWIDGIVEDVTEQQLAQQALRESEEKYRTLAEASPDMVYVCNPEGRVLYVNSRGAAAFGLPAEKLAGKTQAELFDAEAAARHLAAIRQIVETGRFHVSESKETYGGHDFWVETRIVPVKSPDGKVVSIIGYTRDISEHKEMEDSLRESEANFRALAENAVDAIVIVVGSGHTCAYANRRAVELTGYPQDELLAMDLSRMFRPADMQMLMERYVRRMRGDEVPNRYDTIGVAKDGQQIPIEISAARTVWQGQPASLIVARDLREQRRIEEERARLASRLLEIQEEERKTIGSMLHDHLGQILTLTRLELGSVNAQDDASSKSIQNALQRLDEALGSVRRLAVSLRPPILDDLGIQAALESLTEEFADGSGLQAQFRCEGPAPTLSKADETCLYRVLQEALTNAAKHAQATRIEVLLRTDETNVCLVIRDNGKGFDPKALTDQAGLGFIGMRERLSRCGGTFELTSNKGEGTTIRACVRADGGPR